MNRDPTHQTLSRAYPAYHVYIYCKIWCMLKKQVFYALCLVIIMCVINIKIEYELYISVPCFVRVCLICIVKNSKIEGQHYKCD